MAQNIISHNYNSTLINQRYKDGYINLTAMAQANGKKINDYLRLSSTNAFLVELSGSTGIPVDQLIQIKSTGPNSNRGTWGHSQVAINCGQWCSPAFAVKVTEWVMTWMTIGQNPLQTDLDRMIYRDSLKDDARLRMTDQVKSYLEEIKKYDDKKYSGIYFARVHDRLNKLITGETAKQMRDRLSELLGRKVKDSELIRDFYPAMPLQRYISMCEVTANLIIQGYKPLEAVDTAKLMALPRDYEPQPIDFIESIKFVRERAVAPVLPSAS